MSLKQLALHPLPSTAMYEGSERVRTMEIYVDGALVTTFTTSGTSNFFEVVYLSGVSGQVVTIEGVLADSEWLSIVEVGTVYLFWALVVLLNALQLSKGPRAHCTSPSWIITLLYCTSCWPRLGGSVLLRWWAP